MSQQQSTTFYRKATKRLPSSSRLRTVEDKKEGEEGGEAKPLHPPPIPDHIIPLIVKRFDSDDWKTQIAALDTVESIMTHHTILFSNDQIRFLIKQVLQCCLSLRSSVSRAALAVLHRVVETLKASGHGLAVLDLVIQTLTPRLSTDKRFVAQDIERCLLSACRMPTQALQARAISLFSHFISHKNGAISAKAGEYIAETTEYMMARSSLTPTLFVTTILPLVQKMIIERQPEAREAGRRILAAAQEYFLQRGGVGAAPGDSSNRSSGSPNAENSRSRGRGAPMSERSQCHSLTRRVEFKASRSSPLPSPRSDDAVCAAKASSAAFLSSVQQYLRDHSHLPETQNQVFVKALKQYGLLGVGDAAGTSSSNGGGGSSHASPASLKGFAASAAASRRNGSNSSRRMLSPATASASRQLHSLPRQPRSQRAPPPPLPTGQHPSRRKAPDPCPVVSPCKMTTRPNAAPSSDGAQLPSELGTPPAVAASAAEADASCNAAVCNRSVAAPILPTQTTSSISTASSKLLSTAKEVKTGINNTLKSCASSHPLKVTAPPSMLRGESGKAGVAAADNASRFRSFSERQETFHRSLRRHHTGNIRAKLAAATDEPSSIKSYSAVQRLPTRVNSFASVRTRPLLHDAADLRGVPSGADPKLPVLLAPRTGEAIARGALSKTATSLSSLLHKTLRPPKPPQINTAKAALGAASDSESNALSRSLERKGNSARSTARTRRVHAPMQQEAQMQQDASVQRSAAKDDSSLHEPQTVSSPPSSIVEGEAKRCSILPQSDAAPDATGDLKAAGNDKGGVKPSSDSAKVCEKPPSPAPPSTDGASRTLLSLLNTQPAIGFALHNVSK